MSEMATQIEKARPQRFRPYPDYKDSGVEWLGEVPAHWNIAPVYAHYEVALGKMLDAKRVTGESSGRYLRNVDVQWDDVNVDDLPEMDFPPSERNRYMLRPGDLLVCEGGEVGRTSIWGGDIDECFYQKAIHRVRPRSESQIPRFFYFLMCALAKGGVFTAGGNPNTIDHLTAVQLRHYRVPFPATREQRAIADFLDRETAKIDGLVARKERLIKLLHEKRGALITRSVTWGLDPDVPMKDSGFEWLGKIPAHWDVAPFKRVIDYLEGPGIMAADFMAEGVPLLRIAGIGGRWATLDGCNYLSPEVVERKWSHFQVRLGDLLISGSASTGFCTEADKATAGSIPYTGIIIIRPRADRVSKNFVRWMLLSDVLATQVELASTGSTIRHFGPSHLATMRVMAPPLHEQRTIADHLAFETSRIDALVAKVRQAIDHLKEFRAALISGAVTGKIDVREEAL